MAKRRKKMLGMEAPKPMTPTEQMRWPAESMARTVIETHPKIKKLHDHITNAVLAATKGAMKKHLSSSKVAKAIEAAESE